MTDSKTGFAHRPLSRHRPRPIEKLPYIESRAISFGGLAGVWLGLTAKLYCASQSVRIQMHSPGMALLIISRTISWELQLMYARAGDRPHQLRGLAGNNIKLAGDVDGRLETRRTNTSNDVANCPTGYRRTN